MSAKGRAVIDPLEYYATPEHAIVPVMRFVGTPRRVLDLGCGTGAIGAIVRDHFVNAELIGVEIDPGRAAEAESLVGRGLRFGGKVYDRIIRGDILAPLTSPMPDLGRAFDLVIFNPPFSHSAAFIEVARPLLRFGGVIAMLQRAVWMVPDVRADVLPAGQRPTFDLVLLRKRAFADSTEYGWHIFKPSDPLHGGRFMVV